MKIVVSFILVLFSTHLASEPTRILFASCLHQDKPAPILKAINQEKTDLFIFLGDNIYGDTENMSVLQKKYNKLNNKPEFKQLRKKTPIVAIWDDHDYGKNDAGAEYPQKNQSKEIMLDFWNEPKQSERRLQDNGIYTSYILENNQRKIHVILPDLRWNRSEIKTVTENDYENIRKPLNMGPYRPNLDEHASMLGDVQWRWLEQELLKPATVKIIASSLQLLPEFSGWESWANFPNDRNRLLKFIRENKINGVIIISGDTHWGEMSKLTTSTNYPLFEITSSGLTEEWKNVSPNKHRVGKYTNKVNYGEIFIDWDKPDPLLKFSLKDVDGKIVRKIEINLSLLQQK